MEESTLIGRPHERTARLLAVYTVAIFVSSTLLFFVQPMFAKMVLPMLGGTPAVWNTCMVFFQTMLLAGYAYAHWSTKWLGVRRQAAVHLVVLLIPLLALPIAISRSWVPPTESNPIPSLLFLLTTTVGLPFFLLSTTNPLLQTWFSQTGHPAARDPYFLYAASNLGSMLALISYPLVIEPFLSLARQSSLWSGSYLVLAILIAGCAALLWRAPTTMREPELINAYPDDSVRIDGKRRLRWIALAFAPSSLMIGATTYISTDIASFPLLWVIPLALYLLSFIIVFARRPWWPHAYTVLATPFVVLPLAVAMAINNNIASVWMIGLHLLMLFTACMLCHGELAKDRPSSKHLTEYYLLMSLGGNLGGIFNALIAPTIFNSVVEYPLMIAVICLLRPQCAKSSSTVEPWQRDILFPVGLLLAVVLLVFLTPAQQDDGSSGQIRTLLRMVVFGLPALICFVFADRPLRFALGVAVILMIRPIRDHKDGTALHVERSFFGIHKVLTAEAGPFREYKMLMHGTTMHGMQKRAADKACVLSTYYHPTGPLGQIFEDRPATARTKNVALLGLGTGGLGVYRRPGQDFTFYEIDPAVQRIAEDPNLFTYLTDCCAKAGKPGGYKIVLGDGRLKLAEAPDGHYGVIVLDAFSSDAVPMHLMTREALSMYLTKLAPGGVIAFHVSNRILELPPVVAAIAKDAGVHAYLRDDGDADVSVQVNDDDHTKARKEKAIADGKFQSTVVAVVRDPNDLGPLRTTGKWININDLAKRRSWTDDFSNLLETIRW